MKLVYIEGCLSYNLEIDGKNLCDLTVEQKKDILKYLIDTAKDIDYMIIDFVENNGKPEFVRHCNDCGDDIYKYTLTV